MIAAKVGEEADVPPISSGSPALYITTLSPIALAAKTLDLLGRK